MTSCLFYRTPKAFWNKGEKYFPYKVDLVLEMIQKKKKNKIKK